MRLTVWAICCDSPFHQHFYSLPIQLLFEAGRGEEKGTVGIEALGMWN